ncbi:MAG TPA: HlyD family efflux transporter periplasmic adaptor subunit [Caulobacteraceae bacterium]|jgi:HlyD family secretion protein
MKPPKPLIALVLVGGVAGALWWFTVRGEARTGTLSGYVEGEPIYLAAPVSGRVAAVYVREGERAAAGAPVFLIDPSVQQSQEQQAAAALDAARARAEDLRKGQRQPELEVFDAETLAAQAQLREAEAEYARIAPLVRRGIYAPARLDQVRAARDTARAQLAAIRQRREVGTLGGRQDAIVAAEAQAAQAEGAVMEVRRRMADLRPSAPVEARVEEVFYRPGEWAAANQPVVSLLPDGEVKLRFFVPEREVARYRPGRTVRFSCDGCGGQRQARITWVSRRPEFTPPVIYSRDSRDRLVFLVEAAPENPRSLNPGLPVDVAPLSS